MAAFGSMKNAATEKAIMCGNESSKNIANSKWKKRYHQFGIVKLLPQRNNPNPICKRDIDVSACPNLEEENHCVLAPACKAFCN